MSSFRRLLAAAGIAAAGMVAVGLLAAPPPGTAQAAEPNEKLFVGVPPDWQELPSPASDSGTTLVYVPQGQSASDWSEMITIQDFPGATVDPLAYLEQFVKQFEEGCQSSRHEGPRQNMENGYHIALAYTECRGPDPTKAQPGVLLKAVEFVAIKAIQGREGLHVVERAWHADDDSQHPLRQPTASDWVSVVRDAELCDMNDLTQTCRSIGRTGNLSE